MSTQTHYEVLGVDPGADEASIKAALRSHQRKNHPDVAGPDKGDDYIAGQKAGDVLLNTDARAEYDASLASVDALGDDQDAQVIDDWVYEESPVVIEDLPTAKEAPPEAGVATKVIDAGPRITALVGITLVDVVAVSLLVSTNRPSTTMMALGAVAGTAMLVVGYLNLMSPSHQRMTRHRPSLPELATIPALLALAVASWWGASRIPSGYVTYALAAVLPVAALGGYLVGNTYWWRRQDARIITRKSLLSHSKFGACAPGILPAHLDDALSEAISTHARIFRLSDSVFTHMVVSGNDVLLLRNVPGPSGTYRWSGTSLLVSQAGDLGEVISADFAGACSRVEAATPRGTTVRSVVTVMADTVTGVGEIPGWPAVIALRDLGSVMGPHTPFVNRSVVVDALLELS